MFLRSPSRPQGPARQTRLRRLAVAAAGGALTALTAAGTALAAPGPHAAPAAPPVVHPALPAAGAAPIAEQIYYGRVIARTGLLLRDRPNQTGRVVRTEPYGAIVPIACKVIGQNIDGNNLWYLLTDGTYAWGAARYIENIGAPPPFC